MLAGVSRSFEKLKRTLTCMKCVEAAYFPEGRKRSCSFAGVAAVEQSRFRIQDCHGPVHFEGQKFQDEEDVV